MRTRPPVLALLAFGTLPLLANDIEPTKEFYNAYRAGGTITLDGTMADWAGAPVLADPKFAVRLGQEGRAPTTAGVFTDGSKGGGGADGNYVLFEQYSGGVWTGPDDHTSAVQVVYDADNVYFGFVVTDDSHQSSAADPATAWNGDSVQLMIANATRTTEFALYNYAVGGTDDAIGEVYVHHERGGATDPNCGCDTTAVVRRDSANKKTYYEIKLPAAAVGLTPPLTAGMKFGLGMAINDGENTPGQEGQRGWGGLGAHSIVFGKTPSETALVTLVTNLPGTDVIFLSAINPGVASFTFRATDLGASIVDPASAKLTVDGQVVTLVPSPKSGGATDFAYTPAAPFAPGSDHSYVLEIKDTSGKTVADSGTFRTPLYAQLTEADKVTPNTAEPGFLWSVHQVDSLTTLATINSRTEQQLAGALGANVADPNAFGSATGPGTPATPGNAPIAFEIPGVINFSQLEGEANGNATPDLAMPGIPGTTFVDDNVAAEVLAAVEFPAAGMYRLIVNSDDAFRTTFGKNPRDAFSTVAGEFNAGRGAADTTFDVYVPSAGAYPMRTIWNEGTGGANIEILSVVGANKVLLNDTATDPQALKTYRIDPSSFPAYVRTLSPAKGAVMLNRPSTIEAEIIDGTTTVTASSVTMKLNGATVTANATKSGNVTKVVHTVPTALEPSTEYTVELSFTDSAGPRTGTWTFTTGELGNPLFVIEAEDFDVDGTANPRAGETGLDVNVMPYLGGAYQDEAGTETIDFSNDDGFDSDLYRFEVGEDGDHEVNIGTSNGAAPGNGAGGTIPINSSDRIIYQTTANWRIGWVGGGNWQNYTRNFPDNGQGGWWKVYAALSHLDSSMAGSLSVVTAGVGTPDQTVEDVGSFSAPSSGGWGNANLVEMKDAIGNDAFVKLTGTKTVRFNLGSGDFDFLIFSPAAPPPPYVNSAPIDSVEPDAVVLDWTIKDTDIQANASSVKVFIDGEDVTSKATSTKADGITTVHLDMTGTPLPGGSRSWRLTFNDNNATPGSHSGEGTFVVVPFDVPGIFVIEAEDFNYSLDGITGGLTNPKAGEVGQDVNVMPYEGGAYDTLSAVEGVDYNNEDGLDSDSYRTELDALGENEVNITASNGQRYSNTRGAFDVVSNYRIGWVAGTDWQNYTRNFPTNSYNVWAALSFDGRAPGLLTGSLHLVTSDPAQPGQTTDQLGTFNAPGSGGWGRNELVVMQDASGETARVDLGGVKTVRFNLGSGDFDYLLFVPAGDAPADLRFTSVTRNANGSITVAWEGGGTLEAAATVTGPWAPVTGANSPYTFTPAANQPMMFARIRQ
mgnify:CR=1 FL=1